MITLKSHLFKLGIFLLGFTACASQLEPPLISDEIITLTAKDERSIAVRVLRPSSCSNCPLIIFSHGANASYSRYDQYLLPLAKQGYRIAIPNHIDSEEHPNRSDYQATDFLPTRIEDYEIVAKHFKPDSLIAAGHSFGALIAQIAAGAELANEFANIRVNSQFRPKTVIALSPPGLISGYSESTGLSKISTPSLVVTGTTDVIPNFVDDWQAHLAGYEAAPKGFGYALVYDNMNHYMNGAYGRETDNTSLERDRAMMHLVQATADFIRNSSKNDSKSINWKHQSQDFVQAFSN